MVDASGTPIGNGQIQWECGNSMAGATPVTIGFSGLPDGVTASFTLPRERGGRKPVMAAGLCFSA